MHTGDNPYSCKMCGSPFSLGWNLKKPMQIHTGKKHILVMNEDHLFHRTLLITDMRTHTVFLKSVSIAVFTELRFNDPHKNTQGR